LTAARFHVKQRDVRSRHRLKARRERRGRPQKANAKRRQTTTGARAPPIDRGTAELRRRRVQVTGQPELPDDLLGALYGRGVVDLEAYTAGREFAALVRLVRLGLGLTEGSAAGTWRTILAATSRGQPIFDFGYPGAERARRALTRFRRDMGLASWRAVSDTTDNLWPARNFVGFVVDLRSGLDYLAPRLPLTARSIT
jgi:hypothetical protein